MIGVCDVGKGTGTGDMTVVSDVNDVAVTTGVCDVGMGTNTDDVTVVLVVDDVTVVIGVGDMRTGTSAGSMSAVSDVVDVAVTTGAGDEASRGDVMAMSGIGDVGTEASDGDVMAASGIDDMQYAGDVMQHVSDVSNVALMTGIADVMEVVAPNDVTGLVRAGDIDAIGTGGSGTHGDEFPSGPPGWAVFPGLHPLLLQGG